MFFFFFFSSRRRHTRFDCDWSSDVCSSDLKRERHAVGGHHGGVRDVPDPHGEVGDEPVQVLAVCVTQRSAPSPSSGVRPLARRTPRWNPLRRLRATSGERGDRGVIGACPSGPDPGRLGPPAPAERPPAEPGIRLACGTRVGSPAAVKSPRTGSATICAACLPTDQPSLPARPRPSGWLAGWPVDWPVDWPADGMVASPAVPLALPLPADAADARLRNQSDVAALRAAGPVLGAAAATGTGPVAAVPVVAVPVVAVPVVAVPVVAVMVSRGPVSACSGTTTSRRWLAG